MLSRFPIAWKIATGNALFLLPLAFILWLLAAGQARDIAFTAHEVAGADALLRLLQMDATLDHAITRDGPASNDAAAVPGAAQDSLVQLGLGAEGAGLAAASGTASALRDKLRALIGTVGDRSNLILDNVLDSYYLIDVTLNRMPDLMDRVADLRALAADQARSADARASFLVAVGGLQSVLDGLDASYQSAVADNGDGTLKLALDTDYQRLKRALGGFAADLRGGGQLPQPTTYADLGMDVAGFAAVATRSLERLLQSRLESMQAARRNEFLTVFALFLLAAGATFAILRSMVLRRLNHLRDVMQDLAADQDVADIPYTAGRDELGDMARTVSVFRDGRLERVRLTLRAEQERERRDARQAAMDSHTIDFARVISGTMEGLRRSAGDMKGSADSLRSAAETTGTEARATAGAADDSARNLATVAAAVEEMSSATAEVAQRIAEAASVAGDAARRTESTDAAVRGLTEAAERIGTIASAIGGIAARTNLLALNATIEAARAGEAGRGFAVVAEEVKQLAGQTARATGEIANQIQEIQTATGAAVGAVQSVTDAIRKVNSVAAAIAAAAEQQGATTREIAARVNEVAVATANAAARMNAVSGAAATSHDLSQVLDGSADLVASQSGALREEVQYFLAAMRDVQGDRRRYERHAVSQPVTLRIGGQEVPATLRDISLGGCAIAAALEAAPGAELELRLPGEQRLVPARVVFRQNGVLGLFFRQDENTRRTVGAALERLVPALAGAA